MDRQTHTYRQNSCSSLHVWMGLLQAHPNKYICILHICTVDMPQEICSWNFWFRRAKIFCENPVPAWNNVFWFLPWKTCCIALYARVVGIFLHYSIPNSFQDPYIILHFILSMLLLLSLIWILFTIYIINQW